MSGDVAIRGLDLTGRRLVFLDTEFTDLIDPELLSIALVTEDGEAEIYLERRDLAPERYSDFVQESVIPALERRVEICAGVKEIGNRLAAFIAGLGPSVLIACDSDFDWLLLNQCFVRRDGSSIRPANLGRRVTLNYPELQYAYTDEATMVAERFAAILAEYRAREHAPEHHALHDARAWREAWLKLRADGLAEHLVITAETKGFNA